MPFLTLEKEKVIRLNDPTTTTTGSSSQHLSSMYSKRIVFPFQDPYDVPWQKYVTTTAPAVIKNLFDPKYRIDTSDIFDHDTLPFGNNQIANQIFQRLADYKSKFFPDYTNTNTTREKFHLTYEQTIDDTLFLDHVFNAFYRQSFYRYAQFQMFKSTTELSRNAGFFLRRGLWGYFTPRALNNEFRQDLGDNTWLNYRNSAKSSADVYIWNNRYDYVNWITTTAAVNSFKNYSKWVGLDSSSEYTGWLKYACSHPTSHVDISTYYKQKIEEIEHKESISADNVMIAVVVNELYRDLTQINRHISRELSLLFDTTDDTDDPPPPELIENGYITITFSARNCYASYYGNNNPIHDKLGTLGYRPLSSDLDDSRDFVLTCEYGEPYLIPDYERIIRVGREDNWAFPVINKYSNSNGSLAPEWCIATNPYDVYQSTLDPSDYPMTTEYNNGRARMPNGRANGDFHGDGLWRNAMAVKTQTSAHTVSGHEVNELAYCPLSSIFPHYCGKDYLATAYAYWCEKNYYDTKRSYNGSGTENGKFDVYTVSNIKSQPNSSYQRIVDRTGSHQSFFLSCGSDYYPRQTYNKKYFTHYMRVRVRAVADKTYLPVFDKDVSTTMNSFRPDPLQIEFANANIRCLRTGIWRDPREGHNGTAKLANGNTNEDPYYMKFRAAYKTDSYKEVEDQLHGTVKGWESNTSYQNYGQLTDESTITCSSKCGTDDYKGSSRPINANADDQWKLVKNDLTSNENYKWYGDYFIFNIGIYYINPNDKRWNLKIRGDVSDIGFLIKTNVKLKGNYSCTNRFTCSFWGRESRGYEHINIVDKDNETFRIIKEKSEDINLRTSGETYKIPIAVDSTRFADKTMPNVHSNVSGKTFKFNNHNTFSSKFHGNTPDSAWSKLMTYLTDKNNGIFNEGGDPTVYTPTKKADLEESAVDYVFWVAHHVSISKTHELDKDEHVYLSLGGFAFGITYNGYDPEQIPDD